MRAIGILLVIFVLLFGMNWIRHNRTLDKAYQKASQSLSNDIPGALAAFKPAVGISNLDTFGAATRTHKAFEQALIKAAATNLGNPTFSGQNSGNLLAALKAVKDSKTLNSSEILAAQQKILAEASPTLNRLAAEAFLPDFDGFVGFLSAAREQSALVDPMVGPVADLAAAARNIDRFPIAERTALHAARGGMGAAFAALGLAMDKDHGFILIDPAKGTRSWSPGEAELAFIAVISGADAFANEWKKTPPDLLRGKVMAAHNAGILRLSYSLMNRDSDGWDIYHLPDSQFTGASFEELRASYLQGMIGAFNGAATAANQLDPADPVRDWVLKSTANGRSLAQTYLTPGSSSPRPQGPLNLVLYY